MVTLDVVLGDLACIGNDLLREIISRKRLLQKRVTLVFFVCEYAYYAARIPHLFSCRSGNSILCENAGNAERRIAHQEQPVNPPDRFSLLRVDDKLSVGSPVVTEESAEGNRDLAVSETFSLSPSDVVRDRAAFLLGK